MAGKKGFKKISLELNHGETVNVYAGAKVAAALEEVKTKLGDLYHGVRFAEVLEAVYETGLKNGRREVIEQFDGLKSGINYLNPGQPKKKKKK